VDFKDCKDGATLSHGCCIRSEVGQDTDFCDMELCDGAFTNIEKCEGMLTASFIVPDGAEFIQLQLKDGQFDGNIDCTSTFCCGGAGNNNCGTGGISQTCEIRLDLSTCKEGGPDPECTTENCDDKVFDCATQTCVQDVCVPTYLPGHICRPAEDLCDVEEKCIADSAVCPEDLRLDSTPGYTLKCGTGLFLCGIPEDALSFHGENIYLDDRKVCNIGHIEDIHEPLPWPECTKSCPSSICPNGKKVSNYVVGTCDRTLEENPWVCKSKTDIPSNFDDLIVCPLANTIAATEEGTAYAGSEKNIKKDKKHKKDDY